jgi:hypothetical protein
MKDFHGTDENKDARTGFVPPAHQRLSAGYFAFFVFLMLCIFASAAFGQTVVVQLINGRSEKPMVKVRVYIGLDDLKGRQTLDLTTNHLGEVQFEANGAKTFQVHPVGIVACGEQPTGAPYRDYSIAETLKTGLLTQNNCGRTNAEPLRGRLEYFARPATWWELFKN